ncbi:foldase protein PrsA [Enterococcus sp. PF1-24]|uniref:peptidyl-prolyl cis-trans isomerase n=1 Tax=unclassified Enterococcus TaxID=2608891 RepID=UPI00247543F9|nr:MULTISPECIES: peptidyl-prolyl cis-trans isomerase [unclassified Enterococcus]MDH6363519.1 foldase protein PrsA [Enterococcus sp. PFB1-1]MDH6400613.1 foldase protein PrsA [Enterococcus sp. PF1-24]
MKKKTLLVSLAALSLVALSACSSGASMDTDIVTMKGGSITVEEYYNAIKKEQTNKNVLQNLVLTEAFSKDSNAKVTDEEIDKMYKEQAESYGYSEEEFSTFLKEQGSDKETFRQTIKDNLTIQAGLKSRMEITDEELDTAWEAFHPEVEIQMIQTATEEEATNALTKLKEGADFSDLANEISITSVKEGEEKSQTYKFDSLSTTTDIPTEVQTAAFDLKKDGLSEVITYADQSLYQYTGNVTYKYYVVKLVNKTEKKDGDLDKYKKEITDSLKTTKMNDSATVIAIFKDVLTEANVKIKDEDFSTLLAGIMEDTTTSSTADSATADSSKTEESSTASSTEESK